MRRMRQAAAATLKGYGRRALDRAGPDPGFMRMIPLDASDLNGKILDYIAVLESRITLLREPPSDVEYLADVRLTCEAIADSLELVTRELTELLVIR